MRKHNPESFREDCEHLVKLNIKGRRTKHWNESSIAACRLAQQLSGVLERSQDSQVSEMEIQFGCSINDFLREKGGDALLDAIDDTEYAKLLKISDSLGLTRQITRYMNHDRKDHPQQQLELERKKGTAA